jgi:predicted ATP-dependent serine protease
LLTLTQASRLKGQAGKKLPDVWSSWEQNKVAFRRGQLHLIVAAPGVGKSVLTLSYALQAKVPSLYISMDTDPFTTSVRAVSALTQVTLDQAEAGLDQEFAFAVNALAEAGKTLRFAFPASPGMADLFQHIYAYGESEGAWPELIIIDNLANIAFESDEFGEMRTMMADLQTMASKTKAAVVVLHHSTGLYEDGHTPIPQSGVNGKVSKFPSMVVTLCRGNDTELYVSVVKNRFGPADPSAYKVRAPLAVDYSRMQVRDTYILSDTRDAA